MSNAMDAPLLECGLAEALSAGCLSKSDEQDAATPTNARKPASTIRAAITRRLATAKRATKRRLSRGCRAELIEKNEGDSADADPPALPTHAPPGAKRLQALFAKQISTGLATSSSVSPSASRVEPAVVVPDSPSDLESHGPIDALARGADDDLQVIYAVPTVAVKINTPAPLCSRCGLVLDPLRAYGKTPGTWKCNYCNSKAVTLNRMYGTWPIPQFSRLSEPAKKEFYQSARDRGTKDLQELLCDSIATMRIDEHGTAFKGEYLPLEVWGARGYDTAAVERTATLANSKPDIRFGTVYKVEVETDFRSSLKRTVQQELVELRSKARKPKLQLASTAAADETGAHSDVESSSSGPKHKKSKRHSDATKAKKAEMEMAENVKKTELNRKKAEMEAKKVQAAEEKLAKKIKDQAIRDSHKVTAKISQIACALESVINDKDAMDAPEFACDAVKASRSKLKEFLSEAQDTIRGKRSVKLSFSFEDVEREHKLATSAQQMLETLLSVK